MKSPGDVWQVLGGFPQQGAREAKLASDTRAAFYFHASCVIFKETGRASKGEGIRASDQSLCLSLVSLGLKARVEEGRGSFPLCRGTSTWLFK